MVSTSDPPGRCWEGTVLIIVLASRVVGCFVISFVLGSGVVGSSVLNLVLASGVVLGSVVLNIVVRGRR